MNSGIVSEWCEYSRLFFAQTDYREMHLLDGADADPAGEIDAVLKDGPLD